MKKRIIIIAVIAGLGLWMGITLASNKKDLDSKKQPIDRSAIPIPVSVYQVEKGETGSILSLPAIVQPLQEADITVSTAGKIDALNFELGSTVRKGQVIGTLDTKLKELSLASTNLSMKKMETDYKRYKELYQGKAATEVNVTDAEYSFENARLQAEQIKQQIQDGRIVAPLNGTIVKKSMEAGEYANPGNVIATVVDVSQLKATVMVNEKDVYRLKEGQTLKISCDLFPQEIFSGKVRYISPKGDDNHNYEVEITIAQKKGTTLKAGTFVRAEFTIPGDAEVLQIPKNALVEGVKNPFVYVVKDQHVSVRKVILGRELGENIEVISGLESGEQVVTSGQINLIDKALIEVVKNK